VHKVAYVVLHIDGRSTSCLFQGEDVTLAALQRADDDDVVGDQDEQYGISHSPWFTGYHSCSSFATW
jgi:hypothetical protein